MEQFPLAFALQGFQGLVQMVPGVFQALGQGRVVHDESGHLLNHAQTFTAAVGIGVQYPPKRFPYFQSTNLPFRRTGTVFSVSILPQYFTSSPCPVSLRLAPLGDLVSA